MIDLAGARHDNYAQLRTDTTGHVSRCILRSGVQRGCHPEPYGPIATISDPGRVHSLAWRVGKKG